ncbi:MAG: DUF2946 family protein [Tepidisphaeraceae bacterium]
MRRRLLGILLVLLQALWLNVVIPGHTRGAFTMPGSRGRCETSKCCGTRAATGDEQRQRTPTPDERARCAVCYFAAGLSTPPVALRAPVVLGLCELLPLPPPVVVESLEFTPTYLGRAPPAV